MGELLAVPVEKEKRERTHDEEKQDPNSEGCIIFDCLQNINSLRLNLKGNWKLSNHLIDNLSMLQCL